MAVSLYDISLGGQHWRYTSGEFDVSTGSELYKAHPINRADISYDLKATTLTLTVPQDLEPFGIWKSNVPAIPIEILVIGYPSGGVLFKGRVAGITYDPQKGIASVKLGSSDAIGNTNAPHRTFGAQCSFELFDGMCALNKEAHSVTVNAGDVSASGQTISHGSFGGTPESAFKNGFIVLDTGESQFITSHNGNSVVLLSVLGTLPQAGTATLYYGCDKSQETCEAKFSNLPNFGGFPSIPSINPVTEGV